MRSLSLWPVSPLW